MLKIIFYSAAIYLLYMLALFLLQRWLIFPGQFIKNKPVSKQFAPDIRKIWLETAQSGKTEAWYREPAKVDSAGYPLVIFAHGNYELIDDNMQEILFFNQMGCAVLAVEYPGYGRSQGKPSKQSIIAVFLAAHDWVRNNCPKADKIIAYGRSLGGGAVCAMAEQKAVDAIILQSTFSRLRDFAKNYLVPGFLLRDDFDNLRALKNYAGPLLILHGYNDEVIPFYHGKRLAESFPQARFVAGEYGHNDFPFAFEDIEHFLKENGIITHP
ncbi:MAG TPA: alpha/beta hydrolase [Caldithrix abyssi]|uniref:Alpha/beta hydrolase n=1 Tax=Caldithrix abyssi TaxID=187145 RepID=A0A7V4UE41_CALAY|nr:alpha/beta hydrolase [Caldithrix abyssi]